MKLFKKILIYRDGNIGDVLFVTPVIRKIRQVYPYAVIDILTSSHGKVAVEFNPYLNHIFIIKKFPKINRWFCKPMLVRRLLSQHYELCIVLETSQKNLEFAYKICKKAFRIGFESELACGLLDKSVELSYNRNVIENSLLVVSNLLNLKIVEEDFKMDFFFPSVSFLSAIQNELALYSSAKILVVSPSCSCYFPYRGVEIAKLVEVINYFTGKGVVVFITGTKNDKEPVELLNRLKYNVNVHSFIGRKFYETAFLIKQSMAVLCYDSGVLHLAGALRKPLVALFGPSDSNHTGPLDSGVAKIIRKDFECGPCNYSPGYRLKEKNNCLDGNVTPCMKAISVEEIIKALEGVMTFQ